MADDEPTVPKSDDAGSKSDHWSWWILPDIAEAAVWIVVGIGRAIAWVVVGVLSACS